ncbi:MAG: hypothetical protein H7Z41_17335 [Cytophagales bacterium]|nr:hypothetical protein [Armatimonadota bacterium]
MKLPRLIGHFWTLPNTLIALLFGLGGRLHWDGQNEVIVIVGGWMPAVFTRLGYAGMSVGDGILGAIDLRTAYPGIWRHELVHTTQARLLGPLYLPATILGYTLGFLRFRPNPHDASPLEIWADVASGNAERNAYLRSRRSRSGPF